MYAHTIHRAMLNNCQSIVDIKSTFKHSSLPRGLHPFDARFAIYTRKKCILYFRWSHSKFFLDELTRPEDLKIRVIHLSCVSSFRVVDSLLSRFTFSPSTLANQSGAKIMFIFTFDVGAGSLKSSPSCVQSVITPLLVASCLRIRCLLCSCLLCFCSNHDPLNVRIAQLQYHCKISLSFALISMFTTIMRNCLSLFLSSVSHHPSLFR